MASPATPSLQTIATQLGISVATVSRIANGETRRASPALVERVLRVIEETGYQPNHLGRALRRQETRLVAMLIANLDNPAMAAIAASTEAALRAAGYVMFLCDTHDRAALQDEYLYAMRSQSVRGYVLVTAVPSPGLEAFVASNAPIVFVSRCNPHGPGAFVGIDNRRAGEDAADYFLARGLQSLAAVAPEPGSPVTIDRVAGFCERAVRRGVEVTRIVASSEADSSHLTIGYKAGRQLGTRRWPQGIFCVSDMVAYGVYRAASEAGVAIPRECALLSVDGSTIGRWLAPWLPSIEVPHSAFGEHVVQLLSDLWQGAPPSSRILPHALPPCSAQERALTAGG